MQIQSFIINKIIHYNNALSPNKITVESKLFEDGIIDSVSFVRLILDIQNEYGININPEEINETNFNSIYQLCNLIANKR